MVLFSFHYEHIMSEEGVHSRERLEMGWEAEQVDSGHFCAQNSGSHPPGMQVAWHHQLGTGGLKDNWRQRGT